MNIQLEDFIPIYPQSDDPDIQSMIAGKYEFQELELDLSEEIPEKGQPFKHQEFAKRATRITDRMLNFGETGTGKTCLFIHCVEELMRRGIIQKAYIFERGRIIRPEVKRQI